LLVATALAVPFLALFVAVRLVGPRLSDAYTERAAGDGYTIYRPEGLALRVDVVSPEARGQEEAERATALLLDFVTRAVEDLGESTGIHLPDPGRPIRLLLFDTHEDLAGMVTVDQGRGFENNGGYFSERRMEIAITRNARGGFNELALRHEAAHMLLSVSSANGMSLWLNEGLAVVLESDDPAGKVGARPEAWIEAARLGLVAGGDASVERVLGFRGADFGGEANEEAYALASSLTWFLLDRDQPEVRDGFLAYIRAELLQGQLPLVTLLDHVGLTAEELDLRFEAWLQRRGTFPSVAPR
jgi:hypothetical protein